MRSAPCLVHGAKLPFRCNEKSAMAAAARTQRHSLNLAGRNAAPGIQFSSWPCPAPARARFPSETWLDGGDVAALSRGGRSIRRAFPPRRSAAGSGQRRGLKTSQPRESQVLTLAVSLSGRCRWLSRQRHLEIGETSFVDIQEPVGDLARRNKDRVGAAHQHVQSLFQVVEPVRYTGNVGVKTDREDPWIASELSLEHGQGRREPFDEFIR